MKIFSRKTQIILSITYIIMCMIGGGLFLFANSVSGNINSLISEEKTITSLASDTFVKNTVIPVPAQPDEQKIQPDEVIEEKIIEKKDSASTQNGSGIDPLPTPTVSLTPVASSYTATGCDDGFAETMIGLVNAHRAANGVAAVSNDSSLAGVSCSHSKWMVETGTFNHTGLNGTSPFERCTKAGTSCNAENIAYNSSATAQNLFDQFKASQGHNTNMLNSNYTSIGIGYQSGYVTQLFR
jgi:uncharacterized protein YkwD